VVLAHMRHTRTIKVARNLCFLVISVLLCTALPVESRPPEFVDCPSDTIWGSACDVFQAQVRAVNHSWPGMTGGIRYILIDGPGSVEPQTGVWSYVPSVQDLGKTLEVEIAAYNGEIMTSGAQNCRFQVAVAPNYPPVYISPIANGSIHWSQTYMSYAYASNYYLPYDCRDLTFKAIPQSPTIPPVQVTKVSDNSASINWTPGGSNVGIHTVCIGVEDACQTMDSTCFDICVYNLRPEFTCDQPGCCEGFDTTYIVLGNTANGTVTCYDSDDGPLLLTYSVLSFDGPGMVDIDPATGDWTWETDEDDAYVGTFKLCIMATDGANFAPGCSPENSDTCCMFIRVIPTFRVSIEKTENTIQGQHEYIDVTLDAGTQELGGFYFLLIYDRSALNFWRALEGDLYNQCDWEYFTYRIWFWPSYEPHFFWAAVVKVIGIANMNNGAHHPSCFLLPTPFILFTLDFMVTDNRLFECQFTPIRFFWTDCWDNTLCSRQGDSLFVSHSIYDLAGVDITQDDSFPTYFGAPSECLDDPNPSFPRLRLIDFYNGGIEIVCGDTISTAGDINLNGIPYEIADMITFINYFIYGLAAFHIDVNRQIVATDMNSDGVTLDVADLVYGIRVVFGDALPWPSIDTTSPYPAKFIQDFETKTIEVETPDTLGAFRLVFEGNVSPSQCLLDMDIKYSYDFDGDVTCFLIYSLEGRSFTSGPLISYGGDGVLIEASTATYYGGKVNTLINYIGSPGYHSEYLPSDFTLYQNYPNPFNNNTNVQFDLPNDDYIEFQVMNNLGQVVYSFHRHYLAGWHQIEWDGTDNSGLPVASGVYYYRLKTSDFSDSKKMILLK